MGTRLGTLTLVVSKRDDGTIDVRHVTKFSPDMRKFRKGMNDNDERHLEVVRSQACHAAASFFNYVRSPAEIEG